MFNLPDGRNLALGLAVVWLVCASELVAQSSVRPLIVVTDESDAEWVKRIGRKHVRVEVLFERATHSDYDSCDRRVRDLLDFELLVFRRKTDSPRNTMWRQRMTKANPRGRLHRLSDCHRRSERDLEGRVQLATEIHRILVTVLPEQRQLIDANLDSELRNLRTSYQYPLFASRD